MQRQLLPATPPEILEADLAPLALAGQLLIAVAIAVLLITVLILRSIDWRTGGSTPFDWILVGTRGGRTRSHRGQRCLRGNGSANRCLPRQTRPAQ